MAKKFKEVPKRLKVVVTKKDIKRGRASDPSFCPIALAVKREYGDKPSVSYRLSLFIAGERISYILPKTAETFIKRFDTDQKVKPFSFTARL